MRTPKHIKIFGSDIKIEVTVELPDDANGLSDPDNDKILINKKIPRSRRSQVLLHEILHMCNAKLGYQNKQCDSETYVEQLSELLNQIIPQLEKK